MGLPSRVLGGCKLHEAHPFGPREVGCYIPAGNSQRFCPQSNDVFVDRETGLIYLSDRRGPGLHILEYIG